ncbi:hypothetical protein LCGC14_1778580, partial [marine sediment metagenome]
PVKNQDRDEDSEDADSEDGYEERTYLVPRGKQIGWKLYDSVFFDPAASLALVNRYARDLGVNAIPFEKKTLGKRLSEKGLLQSSDKGRNTLKRRIEGARCEVFHLRT